MKQLFEKLGFHKMDEMDKVIAQKAQRNALIYVIVALLVWSFYESYKVYTQNTPINLAPCFLLVSTCLVLNFSQLFFQKQAVKDDDEYKDENPFWKIVLIIAIISVIIVSFGSWFLIAGK